MIVEVLAKKRSRGVGMAGCERYLGEGVKTKIKKLLTERGATFILIVRIYRLGCLKPLYRALKTTCCSLPKVSQPKRFGFYRSIHRLRRAVKNDSKTKADEVCEEFCDGGDGTGGGNEGPMVLPSRVENEQAWKKSALMACLAR